MINNLAVSLLCLKNLKKLDTFLKIINKKKINYIELPIPKISPEYKYEIHKLKKIKNKFKKYNVKISSVQAVFFKRDNLNIFNVDKHEEILKHLEKVFRISKFFGAKNVIFGSPKNRVMNNKISKEKNEKIAIKIFSQISNLAKKYNLTICLEPNSKIYQCNFVNNLKEAVNITKKVMKKNFLINADTGNIFLEKDNCNIGINKKLIANIQISEKNLISISKGHINHNKILRKLYKKNIIISLEMLNTNLKDLNKDLEKFISINSNLVKEK